MTNQTHPYEVKLANGHIEVFKSADAALQFAGMFATSVVEITIDGNPIPVLQSIHTLAVQKAGVKAVKEAK